MILESKRTTAVPYPAAAPSWRALFSGDHRAPLLFLTSAVAVHALSVYVVATILPQIVREIGGLAYLALTTTFAVVGAIIGAVSVCPLLARLGTRRSYRWALLIFALGSLACALCGSMPMFLAGRLLQGVGGGLLLGLAYAVIRLLFEEALRPRAIALVSAASAVGALAGPVFGAFVAERVDWHWAFWIDILLAGIVAGLAGRALPPTKATDFARAGRPPLDRLLIISLAIAALSIGGLSGSIPHAVLGLALAAILMGLALRRDHAAAVMDLPGEHLFPQGAFGITTMFGRLSILTGLTAASLSTVLYVPFITVTAHGFSAMAGGYMTAISAMSWMAASIFAAGFVRWARLLIILGPACMMLGTMGAAFALADGSLPGIAFCLFATGAGIGLAWPHLGALLMTSTKDSTGAGAFISTAQMLATAFGSAVIGMLANIMGMARANGDPEATAAAAFWLYLAFSAVPALAVIVAIIIVRQLSARDRASGCSGSGRS